uniref:Uncharacterized protein n=1 Tax=Arundo donax TaxID=35708 RepID=A0A0A9KKI4_ARUDO
MVMIRESTYRVHFGRRGSREKLEPPPFSLTIKPDPVCLVGFSTLDSFYSNSPWLFSQEDSATSNWSEFRRSQLSS